ncbi:hypothetical protein PVAG01_06495 [Phlyctema vagabunda]|uniref:Gag protein n=1 Tax=Phlyctema vagabunda TaxID=108571 RepID=A0ABR4PGC4_9HELO
MQIQGLWSFPAIMFAKLYNISLCEGPGACPWAERYLLPAMRTRSELRTLLHFFKTRARPTQEDMYEYLDGMQKMQAIDTEQRLELNLEHVSTALATIEQSMEREMDPEQIEAVLYDVFPYIYMIRGPGGLLGVHPPGYTDYPRLDVPNGQPRSRPLCPRPRQTYVEDMCEFCQWSGHTALECRNRWTRQPEVCDICRQRGFLLDTCLSKQRHEILY